MVGCTIQLMKRKPGWVINLLGSKFFDSCVDHTELRKNEKNVFCIDCNICLCKHCITTTSSTHCFHHRRLQICKYVYHDVVRLLDIQKFLDCSKIQTYKINGEKAVHLNPRPQTKDAKQSKYRNGASCEACGRHVQDFPNCFCSISCKVSLVEDMVKEHNQKVISNPIPEFDVLSLKENYDPAEDHMNVKDSSFSFSESSEEIQSWVSSALKPKKQLHKRKGIPRRAPLL